MLGGRLEFCLLCIDYLWSCYYNCDLIPSISSVPFSRSVMSDSSRPHESQHARPPCPLPFPTVHGVLKARILKWLAILFSSGPHSVRPLHHDPPVLGCPEGMAWFHWVRRGRGPSVIRLTSFLSVWLQCVCPLMPSCNTYHLTWVSLTLAWGISSWLLQQIYIFPFIFILVIFSIPFGFSVYYF